jgi:hypothetical protein
MYYLPRKYFHDYVQLTSVFATVYVFHEVGIPTIWNIIDKTYRSHPSYSVLERWGDCWGSCCTGGAKPDDFMWKRCGHKLDYLNWEVAKTHYERLKANSKLLGQELKIKEFVGDHSEHIPKMFKDKPKPKSKSHPKEGKEAPADMVDPSIDDPAEGLRHLMFF